MIVRWETDHDYVLVHVHQDMFGDWIFSRAWGQIGTQYGGLKHRLADDRDHALMWLADETTILTSRGFRKVLETDDNSAAGARRRHPALAARRAVSARRPR